MASVQADVKTETPILVGFLSGKKTYIVAAVTFVYAFVHAWDTNTWSTFAPYLAGTTGLASLRAAVAKVEAALVGASK